VKIDFHVGKKVKAVVMSGLLVFFICFFVHIAGHNSYTLWIAETVWYKKLAKL